jgi:hypothetical protein
LASDTKANARDGFTASLWNNIPAFLTMGQALTIRQPTSGKFYTVFYRGVYLILHSPVTGPTNSHDMLLAPSFNSLLN